MMRIKTRIIKEQRRNRWWVLDNDGWAIMSFSKPSKARIYRHLYSAYMSVPEDQMHSIILKIKQLGD